MDYLSNLKSNYEIFLNFMKEKYPVFNNSNIFLRDVQYSLRNYFQKNLREMSNSEAEKIARDLTSFLEEKEVLKRISKNSWKVNYSFKNVVIDNTSQNSS
ncbi:MAG: hypothetical protein FJ214_11770 [Ignavibacteria bacterium]|nr:hypothetical protein [Ignavibacteria bacterium]